MKKSQASIEFLFAIGIILLIFIILFGISINKRTELVTTQNDLNKLNTCLEISNLINEIFLIGINTNIIITSDYNIKINKETIYIDDGFYCTTPFSTSFLPVSLNKGSIKIENTNNTVTLKNV